MRLDIIILLSMRVLFWFFAILPQHFVIEKYLKGEDFESPFQILPTIIYKKSLPRSYNNAGISFIINVLVFYVATVFGFFYYLGTLQTL